MITFGPQPAGGYREYTITLDAGEFTGDEPLEAMLLDARGVVVATPALTWIDPVSRQLCLEVAESDTLDLDPGSYRLDARITVEGHALEVIQDAYLVLTGPGPAVSPVSLEEARHHMRVTSRVDDGEIARQTRAAVDAVERLSGKVLVRRAVESSFHGFPGSGALRLPFGPLVSVESITYDDVDGMEATLDGAGYWIVTSEGSVGFWPGMTPWTRQGPGSVRVAYTAGYAPGACPEVLREAVLHTVAYRYAHRVGAEDEMGLPPAAVALCRLASEGAYP